MCFRNLTVKISDFFPIVSLLDNLWLYQNATLARMSYSYNLFANLK